MTRNKVVRRGALIASITCLLVVLASGPAIACDRGDSAAGAVELVDGVAVLAESGMPVEVQAISSNETELNDPELTAVFPEALASTVGGPITRAEIMSRARSWLGQGLVYHSSPSARAPDPEGLLYRRDCSGFLSMAWHLNNEPNGGPSTSELARWASPVIGGRAGLQMGDMLLWAGEHAMLFVAHESNGLMRVIDFTDTYDMAERSLRPESNYMPYRYNNLDEGGVVPADSRRIIVTNERGDVHVKEGDLYATWQTITTGMRKVVASGTRIVALDWGGNVHAKEGPVNAPWWTIASGATDIATYGNRIAFLNANGGVAVKEGALNAGWLTVLPSGAAKVVLAGSKIAIMDFAGNVSAKVGALDSGWLAVAQGMQDVAMSPNRIIVQHWGGAISGEEGTIQGPWSTLLAEGSAKISVSDSIVAFIDNSGNVNAKYVGLNAPWTAIEHGQVEIATSGSRLAVRNASGLTQVMDFPSGLVTMGSGYTSVTLS